MNLNQYFINAAIEQWAAVGEATFEDALLMYCAAGSSHGM